MIFFYLKNKQWNFKPWSSLPSACLLAETQHRATSIFQRPQLQPLMSSKRPQLHRRLLSAERTNELETPLWRGHHWRPTTQRPGRRSTYQSSRRLSTTTASPASTTTSRRNLASTPEIATADAGKPVATCTRAAMWVSACASRIWVGTESLKHVMTTRVSEACCHDNVAIIIITVIVSSSSSSSECHREQEAKKFKEQ